MLVQKQVWLPEEEFHKYAGKSAPISLLGYHIIQRKRRPRRDTRSDRTAPPVALPHIPGGKEALIPVHQEALQKIDKKNKQVMVSLPEGLLDIFR